MPRPSARSSVPDSRRRTAAHSSSGRMARDQALAWSSPVAAICGRRFRIDLGERRQMMHLVDHQQRAMAPELAQMQIRRGRDALIGRDIAGQAAARVRRIVRRTQRQGVAERRAPGRVGEGLLGLQAQSVARHHPADPLDNAGCDQPRGGDHRQQRLAAARGDGGEDIAGLRPAGDDGLDHAGKLLLMGAQRTRGRNTHRNCRTAMSSRNVEPQCRPLAGSRSRRFGCLAGTSTNQVRLSVIRKRIGDNENAEVCKQRANNHRRSCLRDDPGACRRAVEHSRSGGAAHGTEPAPLIAAHTG